MAKENKYKLITSEKDFLRLSKINKKNINFIKIKVKINGIINLSKILKKI